MSMEARVSKTVLITGASSGIGRATALRYAKLGFSLLLCGRRKERLQQLADEINSPTTLATFDISQPAEIDGFFSDNLALLKKVDILVNSAGLAKGAEKVQDANIQDWEVMIDTNIKGLFYLTRKMVSLMSENKRGHIVNLGSVAGRWVYPGGAIYCATKFAVRGFSEALRQDLNGKNIRVTVIEPGMVNTEFSTVRFNSKEKADAVYAGMTPLSAEDIAETILWSTALPEHVNIQELVIYPTDQAHATLVHRR
jgi:3-hydroxy acid dehydrogenase / malonic semialdehyde reductase